MGETKYIYVFEISVQLVCVRTKNSVRFDICDNYCNVYKNQSLSETETETEVVIYPQSSQ